MINGLVSSSNYQTKVKWLPSFISDIPIWNQSYINKQTTNNLLRGLTELIERSFQMNNKNDNLCDLETGICGDGGTTTSPFIDLSAKNKEPIQVDDKEVNTED